MTRPTTQNIASLRGSEKRHPVGAYWRCSCQLHELKKVKNEAAA